MKLQLALDDITLENSVDLITQVQESVDIIEVGTPFLMKYGVAAITRLKQQFPDLEILCDAKIMDAGEYEAKICFDAGADYITVLGVTDILTIRDCVKEARRQNKKVMVDMICVNSFAEAIPRIEAEGVDVIAVHTGVDQQAKGRTPLEDLREMNEYVEAVGVGVAGGITVETIAEYVSLKPEIIIVGSGIIKAKDPVAAAHQIASKIKEEQAI